MYASDPTLGRQKRLVLMVAKQKTKVRSLQKRFGYCTSMAERHGLEMELRSAKTLVKRFQRELERAGTKEHQTA